MGDAFVYLSEWQVLLCTSCDYCLRPEYMLTVLLFQSKFYEGDPLYHLLITEKIGETHQIVGAMSLERPQGDFDRLLKDRRTIQLGWLLHLNVPERKKRLLPISGVHTSFPIFRTEILITFQLCFYFFSVAWCSQGHFLEVYGKKNRFEGSESFH
jgi:hypothetical protein